MKEQTRTGADIRARLGHPVIDGDGHLIEFTPVLLDYIAKVGGHEVAERYAAAPVKRQFTLASLNAILGSDISHWDVPNMNEVLVEAWEQVERDLLTEQHFHDFAFANTVRLQGGVNPDFFKGTAVESEAAKVLG